MLKSLPHLVLLKLLKLSMIRLFYLFLFFFISNNLIAKENIMILELKDGIVEIELFEKIAPSHVQRIKKFTTKSTIKSLKNIYV